jgi:hypothetical protein
MITKTYTTTPVINQGKYGQILGEQTKFAAMTDSAHEKK